MRLKKWGKKNDVLVQFTVLQNFGVAIFFKKLVVSKNKKGGISMEIFAVSARKNEDSGENIFNDTFALPFNGPTDECRNIC